MHKIKINYDKPSVRNIPITMNIRRCVEATLSIEKVDTACEINILVTDDSGIRAINAASRNIDKATDVLSDRKSTRLNSSHA